MGRLRVTDIAHMQPLAHSIIIIIIIIKNRTNSIIEIKKIKNG